MIQSTSGTSLSDKRGNTSKSTNTVALVIHISTSGVIHRVMRPPHDSVRFPWWKTPPPAFLSSLFSTPHNGLATSSLPFCSSNRHPRSHCHQILSYRRYGRWHIHQIPRMCQIPEVPCAIECGLAVFISRGSVEVFDMIPGFRYSLLLTSYFIFFGLFGTMHHAYRYYRFT